MSLIGMDQPFDKEEHRQKIKRRMINKDRVQCIIRVPKKVHLNFQKKLVEERKKMNSVVVDMILKYIENQ